MRHGLCWLRDRIIKCILYTCKMFAYEWNMVEQSTPVNFAFFPCDFNHFGPDSLCLASSANNKFYTFSRWIQTSPLWWKHLYLSALLAHRNFTLLLHRLLVWCSIRMFISRNKMAAIIFSLHYARLIVFLIMTFKRYESLLQAYTQP